jgi:hypothetical protein
VKRLFVFATLFVLLTALGAFAQPWGRESVHIISGWLDAATSEVYYDATVDSVLRVRLGKIPTNAIITGVGAYTLDGWDGPIVGAADPADSICVGYTGDLDCILDETSCASAGLDATLVAGAIVNNATDGATAYTPCYGYYRITTNGQYRYSGKTYFWVEYHDGISEP